MFGIHGLDALGLAHALFGVAALLFGLAVVLRRKGTRTHTLTFGQACVSRCGHLRRHHPLAADGRIHDVLLRPVRKYLA